MCQGPDKRERIRHKKKREANDMTDKYAPQAAECLLTGGL